ncbi:ROK family protein [Paenibacillus donghaensis]|uniref:Transcriptional regulator n=1 Tax=Paenibacillus donghaensis TaxID=414771 RepID=A0A2Z2K749_9BACL|nr:ROK family protein [Paenibacillus donghaensis]ASA20787.1 transcriptional regulator [Paenibacillus donghaensis]
MDKASPNLMKEINLNTVRRAMKQHGKATKPQLAALTGLSVVTIQSLMKELIELGEVEEDALIPSNGGRPVLNYRFNYNHSLALVIHMNELQVEDIVFVAVFNLNGDPLLNREYSFKDIFNRKIFYRMLDELLALFPSIKVMGIGIPGQSVNGKIIVSSHQELQGVELAGELERRYGLPVVLENDVNAAVSGYCHHKQTAEEQCILGIYFPEKYPPGVGIYLNEGIVKGKNGMAGEIKFLPLNVDWYRAMTAEVFIETVCTIVQTLSAVLAPDQIVIYREQIDVEAWRSGWDSYQSTHGLPSAPEIRISNAFYEDFKEGMKWLTLQALEPKLQNQL